MADRISDKALLEAIKKHKTAEAICKAAGDLKKATLRNRVGLLMQKQQAFINIPGLYSPSDETEFKKNGISIGYTKLSDTSFVTGDKFKIAADDKKGVITLTRFKSGV
jgi:hypothetical protein